MSESTKCIVKVDGTEVSGLGAVYVDQRMDSPDMFNFEVFIIKAGAIQSLDTLREGQPVEILITTETNEQVTICKGEIHYIESHFRMDGSSTVNIGGYDLTHRLTRGTQSRTWGDGHEEKQGIGSAVEEVISGAKDYSGSQDGLNPGVVEGSDTELPYIPQLNVSDYQFIKSLGYFVGVEVAPDTLTDSQKVNFRKIDPSQEPVRILSRHAGKDGATGVREANFSLSTVRQYGRVEVRSWDPLNKKAIVGKAEATDFSFGGDKTAPDATGHALYGKDKAGKVLTITDHPVDSIEEAEGLAQSIMNQMALEFVTGDVDLAGDPMLAAGKIVELKDFGARFSGKYLITQCTHSVTPKGSGYRTNLKIARSDVGTGNEDVGDASPTETNSMG